MGGLYPQRQGGDAFMLRIKIPGGRLDAAQAGSSARSPTPSPAGSPNPVFGDAYLDITTRQDIQLHWIRIGAVPEIWGRLEAVGMTTVQACGDSARCSAARCRAWTPTRCWTPTRSPRRSPTSSPATASTPTCPASSS